MIETKTTSPLSATSVAKVDLPAATLIQQALANGEGELADNGALVVKTGKRTGRSPKDRFIVKDMLTESSVAWNHINQPVSNDVFTALWDKATQYLNDLPQHYQCHLQVGAHPVYHIPVKVITELAWHALFAKNLFIREATTSGAAENTWTILSLPNFKTEAALDGVHSDAAIILNFTQRRLLILGTHYAGEMKKGMFSVLNFILPQHDILPMHCAANANQAGDTALFFGLSGTGKTTLSADPDRFLIGDDEHGWGADGIFNFEGGCYAKCIDLSQEREPLIWHAIRNGTVIENVVLDPTHKTPIYADASLTQNTRAAYPLEFIPARVLNNQGRPPQAVLFLTCDLYGVLPPVARLTPDQAAYYFLSGYTAMVGSTEVGTGSGITPTFSTCFGAPFFPRSAQTYANLLKKRLQESQAQVYLLNTGWTGGSYGQGGVRFSIPTTRSIVQAILTGKLNQAAYECLPFFNLDIPKEIPGLDAKLLNPKHNWQDQTSYQQNIEALITKFIENFKRFDVDATIVAAGPTLTS